MSISSITAVELFELSVGSGGGLTVIDVREPDEYAAYHAPIGVNHPLGVLSRGELGPLSHLGLHEPVYLICRSGQRSMRAAALLRDRGFSRLINVAGGVLAWQVAGLPAGGRASS